MMRMTMMMMMITALTLCWKQLNRKTKTGLYQHDFPCWFMQVDQDSSTFSSKKVHWKGYLLKLVEQEDCVG